MGCITLDSFRRLLAEKYGSIVTGWRQVLDSAGNGRVSFNELGMALRELPFQGSMKELWAELGGDVVGHITLGALDPEAEQMIRNVRELLLSRYESLVDAWKQYLDLDGNIWLDEAEFAAKLGDLGYDCGGAKQFHKFYRMFMPDKVSRHLHVEDMEVLLIGVPNADRKRVWMSKPPPPPVIPAKMRSRPTSGRPSPSSTLQSTLSRPASGRPSPTASRPVSGRPARPLSAVFANSKGPSSPTSPSPKATTAPTSPQVDPGA